MARLLLVDDDHHVLRGVALALAVDDHRIELLDGEEVGSVLEARLDGALPDLVVLARELPDGDGLDALRLLRDRPAWRDVPVVVVSRQASDGATWDGWSAGASCYVAPPPGAARLRELVVEQLVQQSFG